MHDEETRAAVRPTVADNTGWNNVNGEHNTIERSSCKGNETREGIILKWIVSLSIHSQHQVGYQGPLPNVGTNLD